MLPIDPDLKEPFFSFAFLCRNFQLEVSLLFKNKKDKEEGALWVITRQKLSATSYSIIFLHKEEGPHIMVAKGGYS